MSVALPASPDLWPVPSRGPSLEGGWPVVSMEAAAVLCGLNPDAANTAQSNFYRAHSWVEARADFEDLTGAEQALEVIRWRALGVSEYREILEADDTVLEYCPQSEHHEVVVVLLDGKRWGAWCDYCGDNLLDGIPTPPDLVGLI